MKQISIKCAVAMTVAFLVVSGTETAKAASQGNGPSGWWDNTTLSGLAFLDLSYIHNSNAGSESASNGTSFDVKRLFIGIDHQFDKVFSANLTTDTVYNSADNSTQILVKTAYLQAKLDDRLIVRLGSAGMPWIPYVDGVSGYRFVEPSLVDRTNFGHGEDWGVHALGSFATGLVSYQFSVVNGAGFRKPTRADSVDLEGRVSLNYRGLQMAVGGYSGKEGTAHGTATHHTYNRFNILAAYTLSGLRIGAEYFIADNQGNETGTVATHGIGHSVFASYRINKQWSVFGRTDEVRPYSQDMYHKAFRNTFFDLGVSYSPRTAVDIALVYKYDAGSKGAFNDANGMIGGNFGSASSSGTNGVYREIGMFLQYSW